MQSEDHAVAGSAGSRGQIAMVGPPSRSRGWPLSDRPLSVVTLAVPGIPPAPGRQEGRSFLTVSANLRGSRCRAGANNTHSPFLRVLLSHCSASVHAGICQETDFFPLCFSKSHSSFRADLWRGLSSPLNLKWSFSFLFYGHMILWFL